MYLSRNITYLRKIKKVTQKELADALGLKSHTTIGKWEDESTKPSLDQLEELAAYFGVDLQTLMFKHLETGKEIENKVGDKDRVVRLLEKELDRLEALEKEILETPGALEALRKIAPELAKKIEGN